MVPVKTPRADSGAFWAQINRQASRTKYSHSRKESGQDFLDIQDRTSYTPSRKIEVLIKRILHGWPDLWFEKTTSYETMWWIKQASPFFDDYKFSFIKRRIWTKRERLLKSQSLLWYWFSWQGLLLFISISTKTRMLFLKVLWRATAALKQPK